MLIAQRAHLDGMPIAKPDIRDIVTTHLNMYLPVSMDEAIQPAEESILRGNDVLQEVEGDTRDGVMAEQFEDMESSETLPAPELGEGNIKTERTDSDPPEIKEEIQPHQM